MLGLGWFPAQIGGLNRYYRELLEHLPEAGGVVVGPAPDAAARVLATSRHDAPLKRRLAGFWLASRRLAARSDLVDAHFALYALPCVLLGRARRLPLVVHFQGPWAHENTVQGDASQGRRRARESLEKLVYRRADLVVTLSGAFRRLIIERYGVSPWSVVIQPPGVDLARFSPGDRAAARARLDIPDGAFVVSCVRRLVPRMGLSVLLEAWEDVPGLLLIAGDGVLRAELEGQIEARGLGACVRLLGRVDDETLVDLYRSADLNVVPSVSFEGFGLVVAEAAGCGTPSVVTRVGGLPETVAGLGSDLVVAPDDAPALRARLRAAAEGQRPPREQVRSWSERYGWAHVASAHRALYRRTLDRDTRATTTTRRLRVLYVDHVARLSGGEIALERLLLALSDSVEAHVILAEDGPLVDRLIGQGISVEVLPMRSSARDLRKDNVRPGRTALSALPATGLYVLRLAWRLRRLRPDLVHTNSLKAGVCGSIAARLAGVPVVWHLRDRIDLDYLPRLAAAIVRAMILLLARVVIANSDATLQSLGRRSPRVEYAVVHDVVDPVAERLRPASAGDCLRIGIVGRLAHWKGQHIFLEAFARAFPAGPHRAIIIGSALFGEDRYADSLRRTAAELGISDRVEFRGFREDIPAELAQLDVLVHASITAEPFGMVVLEGLAAGIPVLACDEGGPGEIITHDVDGLLYHPGDAGALAERLGQLVDDPALRNRLSEAGRHRAKDFSPALMAEHVMRIYETAAPRPAA